ncbi:MAG: hydrogenase iron-sulfur subunit [Candidatus Eisenbacteria bacterium]|nr:hydrogenase iron-sulfur subunit [Candidatus Eisenbacteria bacterium]
MKKEKQASGTPKARPAAKKVGATAGTGAPKPAASKKENPLKSAPTDAAPVEAATASKGAAAGGARFEPRIVAFVCEWCGDGQEADGANGPGAGGTAVRFVHVMCSGRVQPSMVLKAFELGADGVIVCGCRPGKCHYYFGNERQAEMFETSKKLVSLLGLEADRLRLEWIPGPDGRTLGAVLDEFTEKVRRVGPSPLRK